MAKFFVRRPIVAIVIAIITVLAGLVVIRGLPEAQFPDIVPPQVIVSTTYPGADAQTVEQSVATPIEQQMNGVDNMLYMQSTNGNDGTMSLTVTFDVDTDVNTDEVNVQNRVAQAAPNLPPDVNQFGTTIRKSTGLPLIAFGLYSPNHTHDSLFLANYANININDQLLRIPGAGQVLLFGATDYSMRVWFRPQVLAKLGMTVADLVAALNQQNTVNPAGQLSGNPAPPGTAMTYTVRTQGRLVTAEQFGQIVVRANPDGSVVRLQDVSRIELGALSYNEVSRFDGQPACILAVFLTPGANAVAVGEATRKTMAQLQKRFPPDLTYSVGLDTTLPVTEGIHEIVVTLLIAMALVILVVYIFLQNWRATLIPVLAVPVSLIGTFGFFPALGFSVNTLSLFGLVLAIGLVVDDAIVVVEAVEHHIEEGMAPREATFRAMSEVTGPVIAIALILAAVFVPVAFMPGVTGRLYQQFALTIAVSVLISAFNALTLSPALSALLLRPRKPARGLFSRFGNGFNRWFGKATDGYVSVNRLLVRKLVVPLTLLAGVVAASVVVGGRVPAGFVPDEDQGYAIIGAQLPDGASLQRTKAVYDKIADIVGKQPGIRTYNGIAGFSFFTRTAASYLGTGFIGLKPWDERKSPELASSAIVAALNAKFAAIPEARVFAVGPPSIPGISATGGFSMMLQDRGGSPYEYLAQNVGRFMAEARTRPELAGLRPIFSPSVPQLFADVDKDKVMKEGVAIGDVYAALQTFLGGAYLNDFTRFGRQWRVFLQAEPAYRTKAEDVGQFYVRNGKGDMVPLSSFVKVRTTSGPEYTVRFNLYRSVEIQGAPAPGYSSGQALEALESVAAKTLPADMGYAFNGLSYQEKISAGGTARVLGLSLVFVFLILAALYESWSLPFSVLLSTPVAVLGAYLGLVSRKFDNNVYAQIGLVMLVGLTAKNAILIVEFAKDRLEAGRPIIDAALEGARLRLRPILMTSFAFIAGCVPLWVATGAGAAARRMLGTAVISGMRAATLLGIFFMPALFVAVERLSHRPAKKEHRVADAEAPAQVENPAHAE